MLPVCMLHTRRLGLLSEQRSKLETLLDILPLRVGGIGSGGGSTTLLPLGRPSHSNESGSNNVASASGGAGAGGRSSSGGENTTTIVAPAGAPTASPFTSSSSSSSFSPSAFSSSPAAPPAQQPTSPFSQVALLGPYGVMGRGGGLSVSVCGLRLPDTLTVGGVTHHPQVRRVRASGFEFRVESSRH